MTSEDIIRTISEQGWIEISPRVLRNHRHFRHPQKAGRLTIPLAEAIPSITLKRIGQQAGIDLGHAANLPAELK